MKKEHPLRFMKVPTMLVTYHGGMQLDVYFKSGSNFFLYAKQGNVPDHLKTRLCGNDVTELYIGTRDKEAYEAHVRENLAEILEDKSLPLDERSQVFYEYSATVAQDLFQHDDNKLPAKEDLRRVKKIVDGAIAHISKNKNAMQSIGKLLSHNYNTYTHCVNVSVYTVALLLRLGQEPGLVRAAGVGAFLHDIGKVRVPSAILEKPGRLTPEERQVIETHPVSGLVMCQRMSLSKEAIDCVVFHHEKLDGSGYPASARNLGLHVRAVAVCDIYDALTSVRPYSKAMGSFDAMRVILKEVDSGRLDRDVCKGFIELLSSEGITL